MRARALVRVASRAVALLAVVVFAGMIAVQYARIVHRNLVLAHALWTVQSDIVRLDAERERRIATIKRLQDPRGAIPEIHDRLHLALPNESIIYLKKP